jgi:ATP-dependent Lon protease
MAALSLLTGRPAKRDVALSGEITLTGRVLPVAGVREKVLAAKRARVKTVVFPAKNRAEVEELPESIRQGIAIRLVDTVSEVADIVLVRS